MRKIPPTVAQVVAQAENLIEQVGQLRTPCLSNADAPGDVLKHLRRAHENLRRIQTARTFCRRAAIASPITVQMV